MVSASASSSSSSSEEAKKTQNIEFDWPKWNNVFVDRCSVVVVSNMCVAVTAVTVMDNHSYDCSSSALCALARYDY